MKLACLKMILVMFAIPTAAQAADSIGLKASCTTKKDASACYELALTNLAKKTPAGRKEAVKYFKLGCTSEKAKSCSKAELKQVAKNFAQNQNRIPASKKK